ncbi:MULTISPECIES: MFS transporter [Sphingobium]|uniref:MFS transporter n=1 Tax=Sphingobium TaxID=165695 RepID=UPI0017EA55A0|nr:MULTISPECIES: MFS transporter [Sphingobium]MCW2350171.1 MFS family permease [Sphingobium sp. B12D2B]MCW2361531.1 MFS family permease [Sphingobium sp. B10D3B]MCW2366671.1 MFS family permease [Sphingobium sp. B7D2B]MCW2369275.1 MFS family permease [Sphingobium sp. B11D3D]MCW2382023.1 MFS family permease [Sphingobium sp. B2D3B]
MSVRQWIVVVLMILLNALDGFDVLSSAFAAPGISAEWGIPRSALGIVLSAELVGMGFGSVILGGVADRIGRKDTMLICLVVMAIGMYLAHAATGVTLLTVWRFVTGLGIGGMLAATNAVTAESTSKSSRSLAMALYVIGYPIGGVVGGFAAQSWLLVEYDWRAVFMFGAVVTAIMIPLVFFLVPETPAFYAARRPANVIEKVNRSLRALRKRTIEALPPLRTEGPQPKVTDILSKPGLRKVTWLLAFGYMFHTLTFYYILKFAVQIVADSGFSQADAASTLTWANIGGAIGGGLFGFLLKKWDIKGPTIAMMIAGVVAVAWFGMGHGELGEWRVAAFLSMFFLNAAIVGFYAAFARGFPAYARATGTGFVLGVGRAGAAGSPIVAGLLFDVLGKGELLTVSLIMSLGSVCAIFMLLLLPMRDGDAIAQAEAKA